MKQLIFISFMSFIGMSAAYAEDNVLCSQTATVSLYDNDLKKVIVVGHQFETVVPFQSFGRTETKTSPTLIQKTFVRVELTDREEEEAENNVGWLDQSLIQLKSKCAGYKEPVDADQADEKIILPANSPAPVTNGLSGDCCLFPMKNRPSVSYTEGMRRFGARRSNGARLHAASDLYQSQYQPVYAIASGKVLRDRVSFYLGTNVTEIQHPGGFIARYGEMASANLKPLKLGKTVKAGQLIGFIKKVNSRKVKNSMLHFELYTGKASGPLTVEKRGNKFQRRSDLVNSAPYLARWEKRL